MIRVVPSLLILLLLCPPALTQSVVDLPPGERTTQSQSPVAVLTNQDVLNMTKAKLAPEIIIAKIQTSDCNFDTSPSELQRLKGESVPDEIIVAMINAPKADKSSGGVQPRRTSLRQSRSQPVRSSRSKRSARSFLQT